MGARVCLCVCVCGCICERDVVSLLCAPACLMWRLECIRYDETLKKINEKKKDVGRKEVGE